MKNCGFSLIELIIVMITIAIISVIGMVALKAPGDTALELAAKKVAYDISYARERAMMTSKKLKVYVNTPDRLRIGFGNYTLIKNPDDNSSFDTYISKKYPGVVFFNNYSVKFDAMGKNSFTQVTSIILQSGGKTKIIKITSATGRVYVQ